MEKKRLENASDLLEDLVRVNQVQISARRTRTGQSYRCKSWPPEQYIHILRGTNENSTFPIFLHYNVVSKEEEIYKTLEGMLRDKGFAVKIDGPGIGQIYTTAKLVVKNPEEVERFISIVKSCFGRSDDEFQRYTPKFWLFQSLETMNAVFYIAWVMATFLIFQFIGKVFDLDGFWLPFFFSAPLGLFTALGMFTVVSMLVPATAESKKGEGG